MNYQEVWNKINEEFTGKAVNDIGICAYLTEKGKKCALGCFIPDKYDIKNFDGNVDELLEEHPELLDYMPNQDIDLLNTWQIFHDKLDAYLPLDKQKDLLYNSYVDLTEHLTEYKNDKGRKE